MPYRISNSKRNITCVKQTYTTERKLNSASSVRLFCRFASVKARCITKLSGCVDDACPSVPVFGGSLFGCYRNGFSTTRFCFCLLHSWDAEWCSPISAVRFMVWVCDLPNAGIVGSNPDEGTEIRLLCFLCVV